MRLFGRQKELDLLNQAWESGSTNVVSLVAWGGVGKSALVNSWLERMSRDNYRGARRVYGWSFFSQGTGRRSSADSFINAAFEWFGERPGDRSPWDRGARLAELVSRERMLLVLDGLEPLQSASAFNRGELSDPALKTFLEKLARKKARSLCVVTSREPMTDLKDVAEPAVIHHDLEHVSNEAGRALLRVAGVRGEDHELEAAVEALGGRALAVNLLATYIADTEARSIGSVQDLPEPDPEHDRDAHPRRVIEGWARRLGESAELDVLSQLGLFDRPARGPELQALRDPPAVRCLNRELRDGDYEQAVARLREARLIARASTHEPDTLDAHPLVRQHFGERLQATRRQAWKVGHNRLFKHLTTATEYQPDTLEGLLPLYAALAHGCAAGRHEEALDVYGRRISRRGEHFAIKRLGAFGAEMAGLAAFFEEPWLKPASKLGPSDQAWLLSLAGFGLRALGRLGEAAEVTRAGLAIRVEREEWTNAAIGVFNLSELQLARGEIADAVAVAEQGIEFAERSRDDSRRRDIRALLAAALHQIGRIEEAEALFREAEAIQAENQPDRPLLYSLRGYRYCELLLEQGKKVKERAETILEWHRPSDELLDTALRHLSVGCACLQAGDHVTAGGQLTQAVDGLRQAGARPHIPRGLLARVELHLANGDLRLTRADLDESLTLCTRIGLRLLEADTHMGFARLHLAKGRKHKAHESFEKASRMIEEMDYHRRDVEVHLLAGWLALADGDEKEARAALSKVKKEIKKRGQHAHDGEAGKLEKELGISQGSTS